MSRFNTLTSTKTINLAGGEAYKTTPELELISILLTSFASDQHYRAADDTFNRLKSVIKDCDKKFVAQAAVYARNEFGMRSISHVVASELAKYISGNDWAKFFYNAVIRRPDDITEILAYHKSVNGKITNAMRKGLAQSFGNFDAYSLAKYRGEGKDFKLVDAVNILRPKPTQRNAEALKKLVEGTLRSEKTWEAKLTKAGQTASSENDKQEKKSQAWASLINSKDLGYMALLKNLRNILEQSPDLISEVCCQLTNERAIKKSLVLPFRIATAYEEVKKLGGGKKVREVMVALSQAVDISLNNVPRFDGETLVVLDTSFSMHGKPSEIGSLFSAVLVKANNADFMTFANHAEYQSVNILDSTLTIAEQMKFSGGGTNFHSIFETANKVYDRVILLSDMQGWVGYYAPIQAFNDYKKSTGANPFVYSFDLAGYGSLQMPEPNVLCLAGFSDKIFDVMGNLEQDKNALKRKIQEVEF